MNQPSGFRPLRVDPQDRHGIVIECQGPLLVTRCRCGPHLDERVCGDAAAVLAAYQRHLAAAE